MTAAMKPSAAKEIPFVDLQAQRRRLGGAIEEAIARVLAHGQFIMGPEVRELESRLAAFCGADHVITCSSGTDALALVLMAKGVGPGKAVICPSFTFCATAEVVAWLGATPVFADIEARSFNLHPESLEAAIATARAEGLDPVAVISVDLFGQPADYDAILPLAEAGGLFVLCDAAQAFGASYQGRAVDTIGLATATSFFPAKPLGCYGDGGAVLTADEQLATAVRSLRVHGQGTGKYNNARIGMAARLDTLQAAVLIEKLAIFADEILARNKVAARYNAALAEVATVPLVANNVTSVWAQYTLRVEAERRGALIAHLKEAGVPAHVYYPRPLHLQEAYRHFPRAAPVLETSERLAREVLSLPMHPYLDPGAQDRIVAALKDALA